MRLVDNDGVLPARQRRAIVLGLRQALGFGFLVGLFLHLVGYERELLKRGYDDRHSLAQRRGELGRVLINLLHHAVLVLELVDRILQLLVQHDAVGNDHDGIEDLLILGIV